MPKLVIDKSKQQELMRNLRSLRTKGPSEAARALYVETEIEATECKRVTPVDTGNLRDTVMAVGPYEEGNKIFTLVVAGGPAAPYALYVHEDLDAFHSVGQAKYIEQPLFQSAPFMAERVARRINLSAMVS